MSTMISAGRIALIQNVAISATSAASAAFGVQTRKILLTATTACNFLIGPAGTVASAATGMYFPAGATHLVLDVNPGEIIAAVSASAGTASIGELT